MSQKALLIIDMQNDFAHPDGRLYNENNATIIPRINNLLTKARQTNTPAIYTKDQHTPNQFNDNKHYDEFDQWGPHCIEGTEGAQIVQRLQPEPGETVIEKSTYDAFHNTGLDGVLQLEEIDELVITGTLASVCVYHTAASAALRDYKTTLVQDAIGYLTKGTLDQALGQAIRVFAEGKIVSEVNFNNE